MRRATIAIVLSAVGLASAAGCWKEIHEASAPPIPPRPAVADAGRPHTALAHN